MNIEIIAFGNFEIDKYKFHSYKSPISFEDVIIYNILISNKVSFNKKGFKYFIG